MDALLKTINNAVHKAGGSLNESTANDYRQQYKDLLECAEIECPAPLIEEKEEGKRGRQKRSKSRNLLERLINYEADVLRFMTDPAIPFRSPTTEAKMTSE